MVLYTIRLWSFSLTNYMSSEIVLKLNVIVFLFSVFIDKNSFEVITEEVRVGCQVKLKMSKRKKRVKNIKTNTYLPQNCTSFISVTFLVNISHNCL